MKIKLVTLISALLVLGSVQLLAGTPVQQLFNSNESIVAPLLPTATIESATVVHRVKYNDRWWMVIHIKFRIKNALSTPMKMSAFFYGDDDGKQLDAGDNDPKHTTSTGKVYAEQDFTPSLADAEYKDFLLYVPYESLNLETTKGSEYDLKYFLTITDYERKNTAAKSTWYKFSLKY